VMLVPVSTRQRGRPVSASIALGVPSVDPWKTSEPAVASTPLAAGEGRSRLQTDFFSTGS